MGQMRFTAPTRDALPPHALEQAYLAGFEGVPWRSSNYWSEGALCLQRAVAESGRLYIPWRVPGHGLRLLATCTLIERPDPYHLTTELARGTLHRARLLLAEAQARGAAVPAAVVRWMGESVAAFIDAVTAPAAAERAAAVSIARACDVIDSLGRNLLVDRIQAAREAGGPLSSLLAARLELDEPDEASRTYLRGVFQAVSLPCRWSQLQPRGDQVVCDRLASQISWCRAQGLRVLAGPLVQLDAASLPAWAATSPAAYERFETAARQYAQAIVHRFSDAVDVWICAGRLNVPGATGFSEEQRLRLAVALIETVRDGCGRSPLAISFDQPWAEYLAATDHDLAPLELADALVRAELGVSGVALEMNLGYWPGGSLPRDALTVSRQVDRWSLLGIPLLVFLNLPSHAGTDPQATARTAVVGEACDARALPAMNHRLAAQTIPLLLAKPAVRAVVWSQWSDQRPHEFPHAGLLDPAGRAKPLLADLARIRRDLLE